MLLENKTVAIIGGGPGGLMLARLLQQQGVMVKVYERDAGQFVRQQGSTLDLHQDTGLKAMEIAGLMDEFKKYYRPGADKMRIVDRMMQILVDDEHDNTFKADFGDPHFRPEIDRGPLRDLLIESINKEHIVWNSKFSKLTAKGAGWEILFENGSTAYADLVIAADGSNSLIRPYITNVKPVYSGVTAIEINIYNAEHNSPKLWQLVNEGKLFALEQGKTLLFGPKADGTLSLLIGLKTSENWLEKSGIDFSNASAVSLWFQEEFKEWDPQWQEIFQTKELSIIPRPMYHFPLDQHWQSLGNLTMIGDAAHRMPPYAGEGANQALADALELYEALCLEEHATLIAAISHFEQKMCLRTSEITAITLEMTATMHESNNLPSLLEFFNQNTVSPNRS